MNVSDADKGEILAGLMNPLMELLGEQAEDHDVTADDIIDFFSYGIAAVIDNDSHLTTPQLHRLAVEAAGKRIAARVKAIGEYRSLHGRSFLSAVLEGGGEEGPTN